MMKKVGYQFECWEITHCRICPMNHYKKQSGYNQCGKTLMYIPDLDVKPEWCPLEVVEE